MRFSKVFGGSAESSLVQRAQYDLAQARAHRCLGTQRKEIVVSAPSQHEEERRADRSLGLRRSSSRTSGRRRPAVDGRAALIKIEVRSGERRRRDGPGGAQILPGSPGRIVDEF